MTTDLAVLREAIERALPLTLDSLRFMGRESAEHWLSSSPFPESWADLARAEYRRLLAERYPYGKAEAGG